jgi:hypothetical protein
MYLYPWTGPGLFDRILRRGDTSGRCEAYVSSLLLLEGSERHTVREREGCNIYGKVYDCVILIDVSRPWSCTRVQLWAGLPTSAPCWMINIFVCIVLPLGLLYQRLC